jgi:hypothetical protein
MTGHPLSDLELEQSIELRWALRDIKAERWLLCPIKPAHLETLLAMGLVEMLGENHPVVTDAGLDTLNGR